MKTKEELKTLREEIAELNRNLHELTEEELAQVVGSFTPPDPSLDLKMCTFHHSYHLCPYKDDYTKCPNKGVIVSCYIEKES